MFWITGCLAVQALLIAFLLGCAWIQASRLQWFHRRLTDLEVARTRQEEEQTGC